MTAIGDERLAELIERLLAMHCDEGGAIIVHEAANALCELRAALAGVRAGTHQIVPKKLSYGIQFAMEKASGLMVRDQPPWSVVWDAALKAASGEI